MNILRIFFYGWMLSPVLSAHGGGDGDYDLERLVTAEGREYFGIQILGADQHGLMFRHREGIAKLGFSSLSENLRMLYETDSDLGMEPDASAMGNLPDPGEARTAVGLPTMVITVRNRVFLPPSWQHGSERWHFCPRSIPSWWHRHHPVHDLTYPLYREYALRGFLADAVYPRPRISRWHAFP